MDVFDKFFRKFSYKFPKGYPDMKNDQDILLLENLLFNLGTDVDLTELKKFEYDILSDKAKTIAQDLIQTLNISQDQIQPASANNIVIYDDARPILVDRLEDTGKYGERTHGRQGNFKKDGVTITFKPDRTSGEYYELKPQQLGVTLDKKIGLDTLRSEMSNGIKNNKKLDDDERAVLLYLVTNKDKPSQEVIDQVFSNNRFYNELLKNLGEPLGALVYGEDKGATEVFFPKAGNYPLIDYILTINGEDVEISAKTSKGAGNTVKLPDLEKLARLHNESLPEDLQRIVDIISSSSVTEGSLRLIEEFGSPDLQARLQEFYDKYPEFPKLDYEARRERIALEKDMLKELNVKFDFSDVFNKYVGVIYVKYKLDPSTLEEGYIEIQPGVFKVALKSKNSPGHDSDKVGLEVKQVKK
jgi:hypothetical protein